MLLPFIVGVGSLMNPSSSFQRELSVYACREVEVTKTCSFTVEANGFGAKRFTLYRRDPLGELVTVQEDHLDASGRKTLTLKFDKQGTASLIVVLFERDKPVAMDGADILVVPDHNQLGQQMQLIYPADDSGSASDSSYEPLFGPPN